MKHFEIEHQAQEPMHRWLPYQIRIWRFLIATGERWPIYWIDQGFGIPYRELRSRSSHRWPKWIARLGGA